MRSNGRPAVAVSALPPDQVNLHPGEPMMMACPLCGRRRRIKRHMLWPHRTYDGVARCPGSGQRIDVDLTAGEWLARLEAARRSLRPAASLQRSTERAFRQATPDPPGRHGNGTARISPPQPANEAQSGLTAALTR